MNDKNEDLSTSTDDEKETVANYKTGIDIYQYNWCTENFIKGGWSWSYNLYCTMLFYI